MKIGLIGYGKMGKEIEKIAIERGHKIIFHIDSKHPIEEFDLKQADVCIEFSTPAMVLKHIQTVLHQNIPLVVGTTGWNERLDEVTDWVNQSAGSLVTASNFSIGVNIFFELNEKLAKIMSSYPDYEVRVKEVHHTEKKDYPSGTAISLTEGIIRNNGRYNSWEASLGNFPIPEKTAIPIQSDRIENVPGTHIVEYSNPIDSIKIEHIANNRKGFALGAVVAAEWIINHKGIHTFRDVLKSI